MQPQASKTYRIQYSSNSYPLAQDKSAPASLLERLTHYDFALYSHDPQKHIIIGSIPIEHEELIRRLPGIQLIDEDLTE